ncbi:DNA-binding protein [Candidatus Bathyarchaeota archaeon]|nr:DNA-binding protein [Candidatus Bathyarchaeota archaeon]
MTLRLVKKTPLKIILDSNAFFVPIYFKIDIFREIKRLLNRNIELILISPINQELELLVTKDSKKNNRNAALALSLALKCKYIKLDVPKDALVDDIIVEKASDWKAVVFTNDRMLKKRLRNISVPVVYVRQKSFLEIDGMI